MIFEGNYLNCLQMIDPPDGGSFFLQSGYIYSILLGLLVSLCIVAHKGSALVGNVLRLLGIISNRGKEVMFVWRGTFVDFECGAGAGDEILKMLLPCCL